MKYFIYTLIIGLYLNPIVTFADKSSVWYPPKLPDDIELASEQMAKRSVIKIVSEWQEGIVEVGAGIMLDYIENGLFFLTASHVIYRPDVGTADEIEIHFFGDRINKFSANVYRYDEKSDVAVVILLNFYDKNYLDKIVKLPIDLNFEYKQYTKVKSLGHPNDKEWVFSKGNTKPIVHPILMGLDPNMAQNGNSGGPVLSEKNKIVGMVIEGQGQKIGYAVRIQPILNILDNWKIPYHTRIVGNISGNIKYIRKAVWDQDLDRLKGTSLPKNGNVLLWRSKYSVVGNKAARIFERFGKVCYVEHLGYYGSAATLDEAWRLWVRELVSAITKDEPYRVKEEGRYHIHFVKFGTDTWLARLSDPKIHFEIFEQRGDLFFVAYYFDNDFMKEIVGLIRDYFKE